MCSNETRGVLAVTQPATRALQKQTVSNISYDLLGKQFSLTTPNKRILLINYLQAWLVLVSSTFEHEWQGSVSCFERHIRLLPCSAGNTTRERRLLPNQDDDERMG